MKKSISRTLKFILLLNIYIVLNACNLECQQRCVNGMCDEYGNCECEPGFEGQYCEDVKVNGYGYECQNGDCNYVTGSATFSSFSDCETYCGTGGGNSGGTGGGGQNLPRGSVRFFTPVNFNCGVIYVDIPAISYVDPKQLFYLSSNSGCGVNQCAPLYCAEFNIEEGFHNYTIKCNDGILLRTGTVYVTSGSCIEQIIN